MGCANWDGNNVKTSWSKPAGLERNREVWINWRRNSLSCLWTYSLRTSLQWLKQRRRQRLLFPSSWRQVELIRWQRVLWQAWPALAETLPVSAFFSAALDGKRLELLKEVVPGIGRVAVLQNPDFPEATARWRDAEAAAKSLNVQLQPWYVRTAQEIEVAFAAADNPRALLVFSDPAVLERHRQRIIHLALKNRLPAIYPWRLYVDEGGLMVYAPNLPEMHRRSAFYVDKILRGAKPADLPVEQPTKFELAINLKTAKQIGLTMPPNVLARADRVIK